MRTVFAICLLFQCSGLAQPAQIHSEVGRAVQLLQSKILSEKAWGAHYAATLDDASLRLKLVDELGPAAKYADAIVDSAEYAYIQVLLDSLIQLKATVPTDLLLPFDPRWRAEVIILLSNSKQSEGALLKMREEKLSVAEWVAVNNLLLRPRSQKLLGKVLDQIRITHTFVLAELGYLGQLEGAGVSNPDSSKGRPFPEGFPPAGVYMIMLDPVKDAVYLADGPQAAYHLRLKMPGAGPLVPYVPSTSAWQQNFLPGYFAKLTGTSAETAKNLLSPKTKIQWTTEQEFRRVTDQKLNEQAFEIGSFLAKTRLYGSGVFTGKHLRIIPLINDQRDGPARSLRMPPVEVVLP